MSRWVSLCKRFFGFLADFFGGFLPEISFGFLPDFYCGSQVTGERDGGRLWMSRWVLLCNSLRLSSRSPAAPCNR